MTTPSDAVPELPVQSQEVTPATKPETRPLYWSVRRELWENRSIYIGPLLVAAFVLFGFALSTIGMPHRRRAISALDEAAQRVAIEKPYDFAAGILAVTAFMIGFFYCLDALYGERRDRSILFWKSLPVSDRTAVLAKASIPLVVLPAITLAIALITHLVMMLLSTAILLLSDFDIKTLLPQLRFVPSPFVVIYSFVVIALWHAPIYAWLLMISSWARRATFLWAVLPFALIAVLERMAFNTSHFGAFIGYRLAGWMTVALAPHPHGKGADPLELLTPGRFLSSPGLWFGLLFAALFIAAAIRLRHNREPI